MILRHTAMALALCCLVTIGCSVGATGVTESSVAASSTPAPTVEPPAASTVPRSARGFVRELRGIDADEANLTAGQIEVRRAAKAFLAELDGLRSPAPKTAAATARWVPPPVTIEVRADYDTRYYRTENFRWPFDASLELVRDLEPGDALTLCLTGPDAERAWQLFMIDDVNHVRLPIEVDGPHGSVLLREADLTTAYPLYNPSGSACPEVATINPPR